MYKQSIIESSKELTKKDLLRLENLTGAVKLNDQIDVDQKIRLTVTEYVIMEIETDSDQFTIIVLFDNDFNQYQSGSEVLREAVPHIFQSLGDEKEDGVIMDIVKKKSSKGSMLNAIFVDTWKRPEEAPVNPYEV